MTQEIETVMVLGGRGHLGPYIISSLLKAGFKVSVLSRTSSNASATTPVVQSDYSFDSLVKVFTGQDAIISTLSTADVGAQKIIIDAAVAAKVKRILPSEFGSDTSVNVEGLASFLKGKQEVVEYIKTKESEGLSWTALCTGGWLDWLLEEGQGLLCLDIKSKTGTVIDDGNSPFTTTTVAQVGEATAAVLLHPTETKNQYVQVGSFNLTQNEVLETLERISGSKFTMGKQSLEEVYAQGTKRIEEGSWNDGYYDLASATIYSGLDVTSFPEAADRWGKVLGFFQEETLDEVITRVLSTVSA